MGQLRVTRRTDMDMETASWKSKTKLQWLFGAAVY